MEQFELKIKEQAACYVRIVSDAWEPVWLHPNNLIQRSSRLYPILVLFPSPLTATIPYIAVRVSSHRCPLFSKGTHVISTSSSGAPLLAASSPPPTFHLSQEPFRDCQICLSLSTHPSLIPNTFSCNCEPKIHLYILQPHLHLLLLMWPLPLWQDQAHLIFYLCSLQSHSMNTIFKFQAALNLLPHPPVASCY